MDYAALAEDATAAIKEMGQPATLRRKLHSIGYDASMTITVDATAKTFTRSTGSWVTDGFALGNTATFASFPSAGNNAGFVVSGVTDLVLTCATATGLADETSAAGVVTADVSADYACDVLENDVNSVALFASSLVQGSLISESTRFFMIAGATPQTGDMLIIGSLQLAVEAFRSLSPGATAIYHTVRCKA